MIEEGYRDRERERGRDRGRDFSVANTLSGVEHIRELITNMIHSTNINLNSNSFLNMPFFYRDQKRFGEKTGEKKSRYSVTFSGEFHAN
jgi:hypothetical protein